MTAPDRLDLHVHSRHSPDSSSPLREIAARAESLGLRGFALTDHNSVAGHAEIPEIRARYPRLIVVAGVEISTREGHLLAYGVAEAPPRGRQIEESLDWVRAHGGVPVLAHPFRVWHGVGRRVATVAAVPAIEATNGHSAAYVNRRASVVASARKLGTTGGSDAHLPDDLGRCWTEFEGPTDSEEDVLAALRGGRVRAAGRSATRGEATRLAFHSALRRLRRGLGPV